MPSEKTSACRDSAALVQEERDRDRDHREDARREDRGEAESEGGEQECGEAAGSWLAGGARIRCEALIDLDCGRAGFDFGVSGGDDERCWAPAAAGSTVTCKRRGFLARRQALVVVAGLIAHLRGQLDGAFGVWRQRRRLPVNRLASRMFPCRD